jgi:hypothetical protein
MMMAAKSRLKADDGNRGGFPPDAYTYDDDVTEAAVKELRERASDRMKSADWELIDGYGRIVQY